MDTFSPSAPARVRTLILPVGKIKRSRFYDYLELLAPNSEVRLGDVTPDPRPDRSVFSPLAFPEGYVLYEFMTSMPSPVQLSLAPFELFREPLLVLGIADAREIGGSSNMQDFAASTLSRMEDEYPRMLVRKVLFFECDIEASGPSLHKDAIAIPPQSQMGPTTMRTIMCDITSNLLAEMTTLSASIKALPSIASPSTTTPGAGNVPWNTSATPVLSRTNSVSGERSVSPSSSHAHRMSMPVLPSSSDFSTSRPETPNGGRQTPPAQTFDDLVGSAASAGGSPKSKPVNSRDASRDRVSMSGFGPGSLDERKRNQGKCRVSIVISSLYVLAGRWKDALGDLADAAAQARSFSDHLWHAKALEHMMTCLVLLAWTGVPFKIPSICYPILDRTASKLAQITSPTSPTPNGVPNAEIAASRKELAIAIPEMANMIISIYNRAANYTGEFLPQIAYSECIIRLSKIQIGVIIGNNTLNDAAVSYIVRDAIMQQSGQRLLTAGKTRITETLMKAMPGPPEASGLATADEASILAGIASALSVLGLQRKKAMLLKEYVSVLIRALDDAKRSGAAEAGIHPSTNGFAHAAVANLGTSGTSDGLENFLNLLCQVYGIPEGSWASAVGSENISNGATNGTDAQPTDLPDQLVGNFILKSYGNVNMKSDVLRTCITLCEALPDPHGVLHWTSALLRIAGPGTAPSSDSSDVLVTLSREEQLVLSSTISKTTTDARAMGLHDIDAEYWDEFLVRGVTLVDAAPALALHLHKKSDLLATEPKAVAKKGPFIHNPFAEKSKAATAQNLMVAGDEREFVVSLQNPYDFDIYIESISFTASEARFGSAKNLVLRPYRTQSFSVLASLSHAGAVEIDRCVIKIQGCRERAFPIFAEAWKPPHDPKIKNIGLIKGPSAERRPETEDSAASIATPAFAFPKSTTVPLTVIPAQAVLEVVSISLPQSSVMLLEGESTRFKLTVRNVSTTAAADFVHVSFIDSTTAAIRDALAKKNLSSAELFELEYQMKNHPAIRLIGDKPTAISLSRSCDLEFEVLGKPGLTNATILLDYANLGQSHTDNQATFYTRQIAIPLSVTVNASVQLHRFDILPLTESVLSKKGPDKSRTREESCLLFLDMRNGWPTPLEITLELLERSGQATKKASFSHARELVQPGHIARMVLMLPKIYVKHPHARIRSANERQFVVSSSGVSLEAERTSRELFWYREELVKNLKATWKQEGGSKSGVIDLRSVVRLAPRMIDALKLDDVDIQMEIETANITGEAGSKHSESTIKVSDFATVRTTIHNRSDTSVYPLLRLQPSLAHQPSEIALDLGKRLSWSGLLQCTIPPILPGDTGIARLVICALCPGDYEIGATVEEVKRMPPAKDDADDYSIPDPVIGSDGRRTWTAPKPCKITAID